MAEETTAENVQEAEVSSTDEVQELSLIHI